MGQKLLWLGLTLILALSKFWAGTDLILVGSVIMIIGCVLFLLNI